MSREIMEVTRTEILEAATLIRLFELDAQFCKLHKTCVSDNLYSHAEVVQEQITAINREIKSRF